MAKINKYPEIGAWGQTWRHPIGHKKLRIKWEFWNFVVPFGVQQYPKSWGWNGSTHGSLGYLMDSWICIAYNSLIIMACMTAVIIWFTKWFFKLNCNQALCKPIRGCHVHSRSKGDQPGTKLPLFFVLNVYTNARRFLFISCFPYLALKNNLPPRSSFICKQNNL